MIVFAACLVIAAIPGAAGCIPAPRIATGAHDAAAAVTGDMLEMRGVRIELADIAAPAPAQHCDVGHEFVACGLQAKQSLETLIEGQNVRCVAVSYRRSSWIDEPDILVGRCWAGRQDLARVLTDQGVAAPAPASAYADAGLAACRERRGIWAGSVESPWTYRSRHEGRPVSPIMIGALSRTPCLRAIEAPNLR